jgi:hypothetical protein
MEEVPARRGFPKHPTMNYVKIIAGHALAIK